MSVPLLILYPYCACVREFKEVTQCLTSHDYHMTDVSRLQASGCCTPLLARAAVTHIDLSIRSCILCRFDAKCKRIQSESPHGRRPAWAVRPVIVKSGDDCRQELLAVQLISTFYDIFQVLLPHAYLLWAPVAGCRVASIQDLSAQTLFQSSSSFCHSFSCLLVPCFSFFCLFCLCLLFLPCQVLLFCGVISGFIGANHVHIVVRRRVLGEGYGGQGGGGVMSCCSCAATTGLVSQNRPGTAFEASSSVLGGCHIIVVGE